jgi:hypothetical protein
MMSAMLTRTVEAPGAVLTYDIRPNETSKEPTLLIIGSPMTADGSRDDPPVGQNMISVSRFMPDFDALRAASTRIVFGIGAESSKVMTGRATLAVAERLATTAVSFPGGHGGFTGDASQGGDPAAFAETLRRVLARR